VFMSVLPPAAAVHCRTFGAHLVQAGVALGAAPLQQLQQLSSKAGHGQGGRLGTGW